MELSAELESGELSHVQWLMDSVPFPCLALDCQEVIKEYNKRAREFFGPFVRRKTDFRIRRSFCP